MNTPALRSFAALIALWPRPGAANLANDLGVTSVVVRQWRRRRSIPARYWIDIEKAAGARGIAGVSVALLAGLSARKPVSAIPYAGVRVPSGTCEPAGGTALLSRRGPASQSPGADS